MSSFSLQVCSPLATCNANSKKLVSNALQILAFEHHAGIQVHIFVERFKEWGVGGNLDHRAGFAAEAASTAGREHDQIRSSRDFAGDAGGIKSGRVHHDQTFRRDTLGILVNRLKCG